MSNPVTIHSPALRLFGTAHAAYAQQIADAVNASPSLQEMFNAFESRTLADGTKPAIMLSGWDESTENPLSDTNATDRQIMLSPAYFPTAVTNTSDIRTLLLNLTKDLAHELQHSNSWATRRAAEAAPKPCAGRRKRSPHRCASGRNYYAFDSKQRPFDAGYGAKRP